MRDVGPGVEAILAASVRRHDPGWSYTPLWVGSERWCSRTLFTRDNSISNKHCTQALSDEMLLFSQRATTWTMQGYIKSLPVPGGDQLDGRRADVTVTFLLSSRVSRPKQEGSTLESVQEHSFRWENCPLRSSVARETLRPFSAILRIL